VGRSQQRGTCRVHAFVEPTILGSIDERNVRVGDRQHIFRSYQKPVTASSLFEAVAQGLAALRKNEWVEGIEERFGFVKVSVADVRVEHQVKIADFTKWLESPGRTPRL
jgi:hypothetical protein